jgi:hypothetical protein
MKERKVLIKSMVDVSRVEWDDLHTDFSKQNSVHIPLDICGETVRMAIDDGHLAVSHYAGTWEQFNFRDDARQGSVAADMKSKEVRKNCCTVLNDHEGMMQSSRGAALLVDSRG